MTSAWSLRRAHLLVGLVGFVAFVLTGQYMDHWLDHLDDMPDGPQLMFRSAHIYVLYGALLNVLLGSYLQPLSGRVARRLQLIGSISVLAVPALILMSFLAESQNESLSRPVAVAGIYLSLLGVALHLFASRTGRQG
jgi:hypothetical protein